MFTKLRPASPASLPTKWTTDTPVATKLTAGRHLTTAQPIAMGGNPRPIGAPVLTTSEPRKSLHTIGAIIQPTKTAGLTTTAHALQEMSYVQVRTKLVAKTTRALQRMTRKTTTRPTDTTLRTSVPGIRLTSRTQLDIPSGRLLVVQTRASRINSRRPTKPTKSEHPAKIRTPHRTNKSGKLQTLQNGRKEETNESARTSLLTEHGPVGRRKNWENSSFVHPTQKTSDGELLSTAKTIHIPRPAKPRPQPTRLEKTTSILNTTARIKPPAKLQKLTAQPTGVLIPRAIAKPPTKPTRTEKPRPTGPTKRLPKTARPQKIEPGLKRRQTRPKLAKNKPIQHQTHQPNTGPPAPTRLRQHRVRNVLRIQLCGVLCSSVLVLRATWRSTSSGAVRIRPVNLFYRRVLPTDKKNTRVMPFLKRRHV